MLCVFFFFCLCTRQKCRNNDLISNFGVGFR
ncbi:hypothetical protein FWK35_00004276 [Aphis craccivora]|uniref:Uncharacterized protein n=1 Tax=Aphis craccivora TaxID=307492 RepID=A0A6G0ZNT9_APHCR|nr:hypothetical protein FWK35_00004276 [Aphis craccivora]